MFKLVRYPENYIQTNIQNDQLFHLETALAYLSLNTNCFFYKKKTK